MENEIIDAFAESTKILDVNLLVESMSNSGAPASANQNSEENSSSEVQKEQETNEASEEDSDLDGCFGLFD